MNISKNAWVLFCSIFLVCATSLAQAQENSEELIAQGKELYFEQVSCWVCHGDEAEGRIGPTIQYGPTPAQIQEQLYSNPQMAIIVSTMDPDDDDLLALSTYLSSLSGKNISSDEMLAWQAELDEVQRANAALTADAEYVITERDLAVIQIQNFDTVISDWQRKAKVGGQKREYQSYVIAEYDAGEQVFFPEPGGLYFYENTGPSARRGGFQITDRSNTNQVVVGDAEALEVITSKLIPKELDGVMHTTVMTSNGRYVYIVGPPVPGGAAEQRPGQAPNAARGTASLLKVDALTLNPVKQVAVGGRIHHGQLFDDRHILFDTFIRDPDGLDIFLYDTETDSVAGGVRCSDLGGSCYTSYNDGEFIYVLMQPPPYPGSGGGAQDVIIGRYTMLRPYWVAKIDPENWEVVQEYPYRGYRGDWVVIDAAQEHIYVPTASSVISKINTDTGEIVWSAPTGVGPYAASLNADESEIWVTNKGESSGQIGRTLTVLNAETGTGLETVFSGISSDHVLLSPNGKEMWVTSNGEGRIYVFDADTREQLEVMDMPHNGDAHGLVWVKYDESGNSMVLRDQGGFHNGINPAAGSPLLD
jgi:mono/diheme cytochrome c family protein